MGQRIIIFLGYMILTAGPVLADSWQEMRGAHFLVHFVSNEKFAAEVLNKAEAYYQQISEDLGYARASNFWSWENRVKIYIYPTRDDFLALNFRQNWSHGFADYETKEIVSYEWKEGFLESLLPHEITHLIFRDYVGFKGEIPLWLDEGVAQWQEPAKRSGVRAVMKSFLKAGKSFSLKDLTQKEIRTVSLESEVILFYTEAVSLVDFMVHQYGADTFILFCRQLRDGKDLDNALKFTYPTTMRNLNELEEQWRNYILAG